MRWWPRETDLATSVAAAAIERGGESVGRDVDRVRDAMRRRVIALVVLLATETLAAESPYRITVDVTRDIHALGSDDLARSEPSRRRLVMLGAAAVPALTHALRTEKSPVRAAAAETLGEIGSGGTMSALLAAAADPSPAVRKAALDALARHEGAAVDEAFARGLEDLDPEVRSAAVLGCPRHCRAERSIARLVDLAIDEPSPSVARQARDAIVGIRGLHDERAAMLTGSLDRQAPRAANGSASDASAVRAAVVLADAGRFEGVPLLILAADRPDLHSLRLAAIAILGAHGDAGAVDALARALADADSTVRIYAAASLDALAARGVACARVPLATYTGPRVPADRLPAP